MHPTFKRQCLPGGSVFGNCGGRALSSFCYVLVSRRICALRGYSRGKRPGFFAIRNRHNTVFRSTPFSDVVDRPASIGNTISTPMSKMSFFSNAPSFTSTPSSRMMSSITVLPPTRTCVDRMDQFTVPPDTIIALLFKESETTPDVPGTLDRYATSGLIDRVFRLARSLNKHRAEARVSRNPCWPDNKL